MISNSLVQAKSCNTLTPTNQMTNCCSTEALYSASCNRTSSPRLNFHSSCSLNLTWKSGKRSSIGEIFVLVNVRNKPKDLERSSLKEVILDIPGANPDYHCQSQLSVNSCPDIGFPAHRYGKNINPLRELKYFILHDVTRYVISSGISTTVSTYVFRDEWWCPA